VRDGVSRSLGHIQRKEKCSGNAVAGVELTHCRLIIVIIIITI